MSIPKKGSRKIVVNESEYLWLVKDNGDHISLVVQEIDEGQLLTCNIWYNNHNIYRKPITPSLVKAIIVDCLKEGWRPNEKGLKNFEWSIDEEFYKKHQSRNSD